VVINKIHFGDAYELIKQIPDKSIDLIYTDPPYHFKSKTLGKGMFMGKNKREPYQDMRNTNLLDGIDNSILTEFVRVLKRINIYIWCNKAQILDYLNFFKKLDCNFEILTWHKINPVPMISNIFLPDTEYCLYFREKGLSLNGGYELKSKYYLSAINQRDKELFSHPTIKPLDLVKRHILHSTHQNDVILDPFIGSGTTAVACKELNRNYIGIEIYPKWYKVAVDRLENINAKGQIGFLAR